MQTGGNFEEKLKQRVQRFGEVVSSTAKSIDEKERVEKRRERFGFVTPSPSGDKSNGIGKSINPITNEKIQKRQERFGKVENAATSSNKILPVSLCGLTCALRTTISRCDLSYQGFKRRRFAY